jgi:hypothetical protein
MKALFNTINRFISTKPKPASQMYGRWCLDYEHYIQERKVYLNNMDPFLPFQGGNIINEIKCKLDYTNNNEYNKTYTDEELLPYFL